MAVRLTAALAIGGLVADALFTQALGVRPDIAGALLTWRFVAKVVIALVCFASALSNRGARSPGCQSSKVLLTLGLPIGLLAITSSAEVLTFPASQLARTRDRQQFTPLLGGDPGTGNPATRGPIRSLAGGRTQISSCCRRGCGFAGRRVRGDALRPPLLRRLPAVRGLVVHARHCSGRADRRCHWVSRAAMVRKAPRLLECAELMPLGESCGSIMVLCRRGRCRRDQRIGTWRRCRLPITDNRYDSVRDLLLTSSGLGRHRVARSYRSIELRRAVWQFGSVCSAYGFCTISTVTEDPEPAPA